MRADTLAIDIGGTHTRIAVVRGGRIGSRWEGPTAELAAPERGVTDGLVRAALPLAEADGGSPIAAVGVGLAAAVDNSGSVLQPRDFGIPAGPLLRDTIGGAFGVPVAVDNDANLAAVAEHRLGAARGCANVAVMTLGTNIGLGLILEGQLHRGAHGAAGEAGLLLVPVVSTGERSGERPIIDAGLLGRAASAAPAGYAWIEELVGGGALAAAAEVAAASDGRTSDRRVFTDGALADPAIQRLASRALEGWALIVADLSVVLDLEAVVLTGGVAQDAAHLIGALQRRVAELVAIAPEIRLGSLGPDAELLGADLLARAAIDSSAAQDARAGLSAHPAGG
ncbi:MAG: ROK family protein [Chloroflexota bacterium]|nr:ROK family protein [Chloroflexota bacterium]